jgi:hypothetical protein
MKKYLIFILFALCFIQCNSEDENGGNDESTNLSPYLKQKFDTRAEFLDTLLNKNAIKHIKKIHYEAGTNKSTIVWQLNRNRTLILSSMRSYLSETTNLGRWKYNDTCSCHGQCWDESNEYEIWAHKGDLTLTYFYEEKHLEAGSDEVEHFIDYTINSTLSSKSSLNKKEMARWEQFKSAKTYDIDTFIELWNPKLKRLDKVEEWDAWYEKTHRK